MKITTAYNIAGTRSFRLAAAQLFGRYGTNLQNPPAVLLRAIRAPKGQVFVQVDQSGAESMVVAYESRPGRYRELIQCGVKAHLYVALHLFIEDYDRRFWLMSPRELVRQPDWPELKERIKNAEVQYKLGKMTNHARSYKMGPQTFQTAVIRETHGRVMLSLDEARRFLATWDSLFPEVIEWQGEIARLVREKRELRNLFGFPRRFWGLYCEDLVREAISWIPQSTVGTITNIAFTNLFWRIEKDKLPWVLLLNKHDSYTLMCPENDAQDALKLMKEYIEMELTSSTGEKYRMASEGMVGYNLDKRSPDNPEGLA
ncbi:MAG: hypothetical protein Q6370_000570 [Candidatus Sigynarchaeota archaeon]